MNKFRKSLMAVATCLGCASLFAEGTQNQIDITPATTVLTSMQTALESYWDAAEPFIVAVVGIVVVAALIWAGVRLFKGGTAKVSGR